MSNIENADNVKETRTIFRELGELTGDTVLTEAGLADLFDKCNTSVKRAVDRKELPPPTRLMGKPVWTVRAIVGHIESRLEEEAANREELDKTITKFQPKS